ncbi:hypothetical protein J2Y73_005180 [Peribacillus frigoritolerans]|uniref:hypothetical protein n=1 Tax=Peribacillus frigoritolerans TaxID=450367 RepID=UPI00209CF430|nr:hypothetical protein [Peribacillus frigoritolerans]MCP1495149.1 hypothetical protein [Peribacillus frigoritolerans]
METKLSNMQLLLNMELLTLKRLLIQNKKDGFIFFKEEVADLQLMQLFHLYFYLRPGTKSLINAFPIPIKDFQFYKNTIDQFSFMRFYYEQYYGVFDTDLTIFEQYDVTRPYVGRKFIWYFF